MFRFFAIAVFSLVAFLCSATNQAHAVGCQARYCKTGSSCGLFHMLDSNRRVSKQQCIARAIQSSKFASETKLFVGKNIALCTTGVKIHVDVKVQNKSYTRAFTKRVKANFYGYECKLKCSCPAGWLRIGKKCIKKSKVKKKSKGKVKKKSKAKSKSKSKSKFRRKLKTRPAICVWKIK